ncbi:MAG: GIY-YIG nuclease family protein [Deltaproteobacteria bacterium]|nr:GIY-YIG nuclease family protein [Deltaproteobacteria bacterium]
MFKQFHVYILQSQTTGKYYTGYTSDIESRLWEHNNKISLFTKSGVPWKLVHFETYSSSTEALKREKYIKRQKSRLYIESLILKNID